MRHPQKTNSHSRDHCLPRPASLRRRRRRLIIIIGAAASIAVLSDIFITCFSGREYRVTLLRPRQHCNNLPMTILG